MLGSIWSRWPSAFGSPVTGPAEPGSLVLLIQAATHILNEMSAFDQTTVTGKDV
jgi:hypothetical protein